MLRVHLRGHLPAGVDVCGGGRLALADGGAGAVNVDGFEADILSEPEALSRVAARYGKAGLERLLSARRVLFIGMGSSRYAADTAVALLRSRGVDAHAEPASTGTPQPASRDTVAVVISASGSSHETIEALHRHE